MDLSKQIVDQRIQKIIDENPGHISNRATVYANSASNSIVRV